MFPAKHQIDGKTENEKLGGFSNKETSQMEKRMKHRNEKLNKIHRREHGLLNNLIESQI
jgi:hypothetical protein